MSAMHPRPQLARRAQPLRPSLYPTRVNSQQRGGSPRLPSTSPSTADGAYSTIHRKHAVDPYYQGTTTEGTYNTIHRKHAGDRYYQRASEDKPTRAATTQIAQLFLEQHEQQQLRRRSTGTTTPAGAYEDPDEEFEQEAWNSILDYVPRKSQKRRQPPTAESPPPETPKRHEGTAAARAAADKTSSAARAIPQATSVPAEHNDDAYYQKAARLQDSEHENKEKHTHQEPPETILETHNNDAYYLIASRSGLHPDQDVFENASPTGEKTEPHDDRGEPTGTAREESEGPDWSRDSQDEVEEGDNDNTTKQELSEPPSSAWGSRRPAEPEGPPPPRAPNGRTRKSAPLTEEARIERNRRDRAEWRERRRLRRRLEPGFFYPSGAEQR
ncbi:unnamed protein product, partial [Symbiodinium sp. CCMP2456]